MGRARGEGGDNALAAAAASSSLVVLAAAAAVGYRFALLAGRVLNYFCAIIIHRSFTRVLRKLSLIR